MKAITIISLVLAGLVGVILLVYLFWPQRENGNVPSPIQSPPSSYQSSVTPTGSGSSSGSATTTGTAVVPTTTGAPVEVGDFTAREGVTADPANPGLYYFSGGGPSGEAYIISYDSNEGSFTVGLFAEPLGEFRVQAEQDLIRWLGVSAVDACSLRYVVLTTASVNPIYAGKNLGFSFCPGATPL